jgi:RNA polymerase sigma-70 factor (ECF subfamily)
MHLRSKVHQTVLLDTIPEDWAGSAELQEMQDGKVINLGEHTEHLTAALEQLKQEQKICIELFYLQKLSYKEIEEKTGYNFQQVKSYIQNGKRNLKIILDQRQKTIGHE